MSVNQAEVDGRSSAAAFNETVSGTVSIFSATSDNSNNVSTEDGVPPSLPAAAAGPSPATPSTMERRKLAAARGDTGSSGCRVQQQYRWSSSGEAANTKDAYCSTTFTPVSGDGIIYARNHHARAAPMYYGCGVATPEQRNYTRLSPPPPAHLLAAAPIEGSALVACPRDEEDGLRCSMGTTTTTTVDGAGRKKCPNLSDHVVVNNHQQVQPVPIVTGTKPPSAPVGPETPSTPPQVDSSTFRARWVWERVRAALRFAKSTASFALTLLGAAMAILIMFWALFPVCTSCLRTHAVLPPRGRTAGGVEETGWSTLYINQLQVSEGKRDIYVCVCHLPGP